MGSLVVKLDKPTQDRLKSRHHFSDIDILQFNGNKIDEVPMVYDVEAVKVSVRNILTWRVGESVIRPEFGHNLKLSMYSQMTDFNKDVVCEEIKRAIEYNEPRAKVVSVGVKREDEDQSNANALHVQVVYKVVRNGAEGAEITERTTIMGK